MKAIKTSDRNKIESLIKIEYDLKVKLSISSLNLK